jgi:hypothetical protein
MNLKWRRENTEFVNPEDWQEFAKYLSETNRFVLTDYWHQFIGTVIKTSHKRTKRLKKGITLVRARIGASWIEFEEGNEQPCPISPHEMGPPPKHLARAGRLNSEGIPYLYLATNMDTAVAEVRPWITSELTIGFFKVLSDLKIVDTSNDKPKYSLSLYEFVNTDQQAFDIRKRPIESYTSIEKEEYVWGDINSAFSKPVSPSDSPLKYLPTQYLSEILKAEGYDGIAYKSSLSQDGYNITLFDSLKAKCVGCRMFEVKQVKYEYEESGNPVSLSSDDKVLYQRVKIIGPTNVEKQVTETGRNGNSHNERVQPIGDKPGSG